MYQFVVYFSIFVRNVRGIPLTPKLTESFKLVYSLYLLLIMDACIFSFFMSS